MKIRRTGLLGKAQNRCVLRWPSSKALSVPAFPHAGYPSVSCGGHEAPLSHTLHHTKNLRHGTNNHPGNGHTYHPWRDVPSSTSESIARSQAIQQLHNILLPSLQQNTPAPLTAVTPSPRVLRPRIPAAPGPRVPETSPSPRVLRAATRNNPPPPMHNPTRTPTTSHYPTAPPNVRLVRPIHQRHTRSNNPFVILEDDTPDDKDEDIADNITVYASNQHISAPFSPFIRRMLEPPPRHTVRTRAITSPAAPSVHDLWPSNKPTATPTSFPPSRCIQAVSPQRVLRSTLPATKIPTPLPQLLSPHYIPPDTDTRVHTLQQPNRATHIVSTRNPASITMHALYHVINLAFNILPG
jgi:hypothetical protein